MSTSIMAIMLLVIGAAASSLVSLGVMDLQCGMKWNAIHHDLHLSVLAGVWGVFAVVFTSPHPTAHRVLHLKGGNGGEEKWEEGNRTMKERKGRS